VSAVDSTPHSRIDSRKRAPAVVKETSRVVRIKTRTCSRISNWETPREIDAGAIWSSFAAIVKLLSCATRAKMRICETIFTGRSFLKDLVARQWAADS